MDIVDFVIITYVILMTFFIFIYNFFINRIQKKFYTMLKELSNGQEYQINSLKKKLENLENKINELKEFLVNQKK